MSDIYTKNEDYNIYAETPVRPVEVQRNSVISRQFQDKLPFPVSDPEFSNKKMVKNQKMKNYLEKFNQNVSNKSFISLQENRELFSRKNSSMHESGCFKVKTSLASGKIKGQVKLRLVQKNIQDPKSFRFSDILEEKKIHNVAILEYPNGSQARGVSFQSSKSVEHLLHGAPLTNTKKTSFIGHDKSINKSKFNASFFEKYEQICSELLQNMIKEIHTEQVKEKQYRIQKDQESRQAEKEKKRRTWGKSVRKFERQTREFLSSKEFPWKISSDEVLEFLNHFAEFLCNNKLDILVSNINKGNQKFSFILKIVLIPRIRTNQ
jgi:hypothetical protein